MPYKTGELKGELTTPEIRRLVKAHNILSSIKFPKGVKRDQMIKIINTNGFKINHEKESLMPTKRPRLKTVKLGESSRNIKKTGKEGKRIVVGADFVLGKPKTAAEKKAAKVKRDMKKKEKEEDMKKKSQDIKAEGVKQGAAIQRVISSRKNKK